MILEELQKLVNEVTRPLLGRNLDAKVETWLNDELPPASATYRGLFDACRAGAAAGLICNREAGGIKFGRVIKPSDATRKCSFSNCEQRPRVCAVSAARRRDRVHQDLRRRRGAG